MLASYALIARRSASVTAVSGALMVMLCGLLAGAKGLIGAAAGVVVVTAFFGISVLAVGRAARISPQAMMVAAIASYLIKIMVLLFLVGQFQNSTAFNARSFGLTAVVCVLVYSAAQVVWSMRLKILYVEPDGKR
jgi:ATP synthase protein I